MMKTKTPKKQSNPKPLWNLWEDGITYSLLCKFLECRERFRLLTVEGLKDKEGFRKELEFGNFFHAALEAYSKNGKPDPGTATNHHWAAIKSHGEKLLSTYPASLKEIEFWRVLSEKMFPLYLETWSRYKHSAYFLQEYPFRVPYKLPSGRTVTLRGKFDAAYISGKAKPRIWIQENKTKGKIDEAHIPKCLSNDLQSMFYCLALEQFCKFAGQEGSGNLPIPKNAKIGGILYNIIRRPLADFSSIRPRKDESDRSFIDRVISSYEGTSQLYPISKHPEKWFMQWEISLFQSDIENFRVQTLEPLLEQLCDWWTWLTLPPGPFDPWTMRKVGSRQEGNHSIDQMQINSFHSRSPFGVYSSLASGWGGDYFDYLTTGSRFNLEKIKTVFPELEG